MSALELPRSVSLSFHLGNDIHSKAELVRLRALLLRHFDDSEVHSVLDDVESKEVVYSFDLPIMLSKGHLEDFFKRLQVILNATSKLKPHFTQTQQVS